MRTITKSIGLMIWLLASVTIAGCGGPTGPTTGYVIFSDGSPVQSGSVEFRKKGDQERYSSRIGADGAIEPADKNGRVGLPPGSYDVVVVQIVMTEDLAKEAHSHGKTVPRRYADYFTSGLAVDVADGQTDPVEVTVELENE